LGGWEEAAPPEVFLWRTVPHLIADQVFLEDPADGGLQADHMTRQTIFECFLREQYNIY
jgi:hypothetical protein